MNEGIKFIIVAMIFSVVFAILYLIRDIDYVIIVGIALILANQATNKNNR